MGLSSPEDHIWCRRISEITRRFGVEVWSGEPHDDQRGEGDRLRMRSALVPASRVALTDPSTEADLECSVFSLCALNDLGEVIGAVAIIIERERGVFWVDAAFVSPSCRGQGLGRRLMEAASAVYHDVVEAFPDHPWSGADLDAVSERGLDIKRILNNLTSAAPQEGFRL